MIKNLSPLIPLSAAAFSAAIFSAAAPAQAVTPAFPPPPTQLTGIFGGPPVTFSYSCFNGSCPTGQTANQVQLQTKVYSYQATSSSPVQVLFQFFNASSVSSNITGIYFDDTDPYSLANSVLRSFSVAGIYDGSGVDFGVGGNPNNLPGQNNVGFNSRTAIQFHATSSGNAATGINPGETLSILFNIQGSFADPFNAVITDLQNRSLKIGLQVQGLPGSSDPSAQYINEEVPEPLTILGTAVALAGGAALKRRASLKASKEKATVG